MDGSYFFIILSVIYSSVTVIATLLDLLDRSSICKNQIEPLREGDEENGDQEQCAKISALTVSSNFKKLRKYILCFSILSNIESVMSMETSSQKLQYLHGLRAIFSFYVVFCHYRSFCYTLQQKETKLPRVFSSVRVSVTWFFIISAMLSARVNLAKVQQGTFSWWKYILKRYARLTPIFYAAFFTVLYIPLVHGDTSRIPSLVNQCREADWITTLALIYAKFDVRGRPRCFIHCWYIEVDIMFTWATLPVLFYFHHIPKTSCLLLVIGAMFHNLCYLYWSFKGIFYLDDGEMLTYEPFIQAWAFGIATGYIMWKKHTPPKVINFICVPLFYVVCFLAPLLIVVTVYHGGFLIQLVWIMTHYLACWALIWLGQAGAQSYLARFLSHPFWLPFSRVSYSTYIFHLIFAYQLMEMASSGSDFLDTLRALATAFGLQFFTFIPGILIEEPFQKLVNMLF